MNASLPTTAESFALSRPLHVGQAHLVVADLDLLSRYYQQVLGLKPLEGSASGVVLGAGGKPLLTLTTRGDAARAPRNAAGLFHNAFLMPNRAELAHWHPLPGGRRDCQWRHPVRWRQRPSGQ